MKYALMVRNDDLSKKTALKIKESLQNFFIYDEKNPDLVISIGGDGTILEAVHQYLNVVYSVLHQSQAECLFHDRSWQFL